jgi:hypothetical protein
MKFKDLKPLGFKRQYSFENSCWFYERHFEKTLFNKPYISVDGDKMYVFATESPETGTNNPVMLYFGDANIETINYFIKIFTS